MFYLQEKQFTSQLIQGPLAGYSCAPFRALIWEHSQPAYCVTEMISAKDLRYRKQSPKRYLWRDPREKTLCFQLSGNNTEDLAFATEKVNQAGADIIDLNCGCPKPKIRRKGCGTQLLTSPDLLFKYLSAIKQNTDALTTVKIRVSTPVNDHDDFAVVDAAQQAGVAGIIVHGRHWTQRYDVDCQTEAIARIVNYANVPVIANGDVSDIESLKNLLTKTQCAAVMIARAGVGQPWLIAQLEAALKDEPFIKPSNTIIANCFKQHLTDLAKLDGEVLAMFQARKLAKYYARYLKDKTEFITKMQQVESLEQAFYSINNFMLDC